MQNRSFLGSIPPVTLNLIIVNFIVWLAALTLPKIAGINLNYWGYTILQPTISMSCN